VASDLRFIVAVLTINKDLERIGDLAANLAEQALFLAEEKSTALTHSPIDFAEESIRVRHMLTNSLDALVTRDAALARTVLADDDAVDELHREVYQKVKQAIQLNPETAGRMIDLLNVSRRLERIADHAVNIAEDVIYLVEGRIVRHNQQIERPMNLK
jgi:phosphate transport system protein